MIRLILVTILTFVFFACGDVIKNETDDVECEKAGDCEPCEERGDCPRPLPYPCDAADDCDPCPGDMDCYDPCLNNEMDCYDPCEDDDHYEDQYGLESKKPAPTDSEGLAQDAAPLPDPCRRTPPIEECKDFNLDMAAPEPEYGVCKETTKGLPVNFLADGEIKEENMKWQVIVGQKNHPDALAACAALGQDFHLANSSELRTILKQSGQTVNQAECTTDLWLGPQANGCFAPSFSFSYVSEGGSALPFNKEYEMDSRSANRHIAEVKYAVCVGSIKLPTVSCNEAVENSLAAPGGKVDPATGKTWAKITKKIELSDREAVREQCELGAAEGWRLPTAVEVEEAIKNNVFGTAESKDTSSCPLVWHADAEISACSTLGITNGAVAKLPADQCTEPFAGTGGGGGGLLGVLDEEDVPFKAVTSGRLLGLCVKDK